MHYYTCSVCQEKIYDAVHTIKINVKSYGCPDEDIPLNRDYRLCLDCYHTLLGFADSLKPQISATVEDDMPLSVLYDNDLLSRRIYFALHRNNITTVSQFLRLTEDDVLSMRGVGVKSLEVIRDAQDKAALGVINQDKNGEEAA